MLRYVLNRLLWLPVVLLVSLGLTTWLMRIVPGSPFAAEKQVDRGRGVGSYPAYVRAERVGDKKVTGNGRVYHIYFEADDGNGGTCTGEVTVGVPPDQKRKTAIDDNPNWDSTQMTSVACPFYPPTTP